MLLGLLTIHLKQQGIGKGCGEFGLALRFTLIERQLQYAAIVPFLALVQVLEQPTGVAETIDN